MRIARLALAQTGRALHATANPIELTQPKSKGRTWVLSAQVQSYGIALTVTFLALLLAAGANPERRTDDGRTAADMASEHGHAGVLVLLRQSPTEEAAGQRRETTS